MLLSDFLDDWVSIAQPVKEKVIAENPDATGEELQTLVEKVKTHHIPTRFLINTTSWFIQCALCVVHAGVGDEFAEEFTILPLRSIWTS